MGRLRTAVSSVAVAMIIVCVEACAPEGRKTQYAVAAAGAPVAVVLDAQTEPKGDSAAWTCADVPPQESLRFVPKAGGPVWYFQCSAYESIPRAINVTPALGDLSLQITGVIMVPATAPVGAIVEGDLVGQVTVASRTANPGMLGPGTFVTRTLPIVKVPLGIRITMAYAARPIPLEQYDRLGALAAQATGKHP